MIKQNKKNRGAIICKRIGPASPGQCRRMALIAHSTLFLLCELFVGFSPLAKRGNPQAAITPNPIAHVNEEMRDGGSPNGSLSSAILLATGSATATRQMITPITPASNNNSPVITLITLKKILANVMLPSCYPLRANTARLSSLFHELLTFKSMSTWAENRILVMISVI
ncbi:MAG: hypothetical protein QM496_04530 [Verrucomicrobiota bacterium]